MKMMDLSQFTDHTEGPWACGSHVIENHRGKPVIISTMMMSVADAKLMAAGPVLLDYARTLEARVVELEAALTTAPPPPAQGSQSGGVAAIAAERQRQIEVEGWTPEHDDQHDDDQFIHAAACYAAAASKARDKAPLIFEDTIRSMWPWDWKWWKPKDHRRNLVRAGALIAAEIDRLDRLPTPPAVEGE